MPGPESGDDLVSHNRPSWKKCLYHGDPNGSVWSPGMVDTVLRHKYWFWVPDTEQTIVSLDKLVSFYYRSVGRNANLILGLTPEPTGLLPEPDMACCETFGKEIARIFSRPLGTTSGKGDAVTLDLPQPAKVSHVVFMEDIHHGERIREYVLEGRVGGDTWKTLAEGTSVGHKRIEKMDPVEVAAVRLRLTKYRAEPILRNLTAYS
jgi:alpha-L-fucosidase